MSLQILYIISGLSTGGAEVSLVEICKEALNLGHKVKIISLTKPSPEFVKRFDQNIQIVTINLRTKIGLLTSLYQARIQINLFNPDIVHSHMIHANFFGALCKMFGLIKKPLFVTAHSTDEGRFSYLYKFFNRYFTCAIHISKVGLDIYTERRFFKKENSCYIPNGIAVPQIHMVNELSLNEIRFVTLGRLVKLKNHKLMIEAVVNARKYYSNVSLCIFGVGPLFDELSSYISSKNAGGYIFMMGETIEPQRELVNSNFFLLSSDWEGMPMSLLEACSVGLPCVVTDVGSCKEIVNNLPLCFAAKQGHIEQYFAYVLELAASSLDSQRAANQIIRDRVLKMYSIKSTFFDLSKIYRRELQKYH